MTNIQDLFVNDILTDQDLLGRIDKPKDPIQIDSSYFPAYDIGNLKSAGFLNTKGECSTIQCIPTYWRGKQDSHVRLNFFKYESVLQITSKLESFLLSTSKNPKVKRVKVSKETNDLLTSSENLLGVPTTLICGNLYSGISNQFTILPKLPENQILAVPQDGLLGCLAIHQSSRHFTAFVNFDNLIVFDLI